MFRNLSSYKASRCTPNNLWGWPNSFKVFALFLLILSGTTKGWAQSGCPDPNASNYEPDATTNNGSCTYSATTYNLTNPKNLPATLNETSGLVYTDDQLWTMNDGGSSASIYRLSETDGHILQTVTLNNATNTDWEAITADANYFYIGDFGNNTNGSRTDLKIYRVSKAALTATTNLTVTADIIYFAYQDQENLVPTTSNNTKFDCEAMLVKNNQLHLFTKDWVSTRTVHYTLPTTPGTYLAQRKEEFPVNGLITDAHISTTNQNEIILIGYSKNLFSLFMWVLWDYSNENFFSGNKRQIGLGSSINSGQTEGVTFTSNGNGFISSERIDQLNLPPRLYSFSIAEWVPLPVELLRFTATYAAPAVKLAWQTATETQNNFFTVERAADAIHFKELGQINGAGNSRIMLSYSFTDYQPTPGLNYYRLKQTDYNGTFSYTAIKAVNTKTPPPFWQVGPVPIAVGQLLHIRFNSNPVPGDVISLIGLDGKVQVEKALTGTISKEADILIEHLQPGMYILKCKSNYRVQVTKVMVK